MSTMSEALAHMTQLIDQGCYYEQAVHDTQVAFDLDEESTDLLESMYDDVVWEGIREEDVVDIEEEFDPMDDVNYVGHPIHY